MNKKVESAINKQIQIELNSGYIYLGMASYFESLGLKGFASWMHLQNTEEVAHGMKFYNFVFERGGQAELGALDKPAVQYKSVEEAFAVALAHEKFVTKSINELYELAQEEKDYPLQSVLQWFIDEQVEEEDAAQEVLDKIKMVSDSGHGLYMLDKEMAQRTLTPDTQN
jgi:ferritin